MNILLTKPYKNKGGVYSFCESIVPEFETNNKVDIFKRGVKENRKNQLLIIIDQLINYFLYIIKLMLNNYDLIFINTSLGQSSSLRDGYYVILSKIFNKKVLLFIHGFEEKYAYRKLYTKGYFLSDKIIVLAKEFKIIIEKAGYNKEIIVSKNPVDNTFFSSILYNKLIARKESKLKNILFLSRIEEDKGIMIAIKTFEILLLKYPNLNLYIAGTGNKLSDSQKYVKNLKIKNINFMGFVAGSNKIGIFKKCDIFLFPTFHKEGLPINILEAMTSGLAIISRPVGGIKDFFENGKMGYITESLEPVDFAGLIENLIINRDKLSEISQYNFEYSKNHFYASKVAKKIEKIYSSIIEENK